MGLMPNKWRGPDMPRGGEKMSKKEPLQRQYHGKSWSKLSASEKLGWWSQLVLLIGLGMALAGVLILICMAMLTSIM